jgi:hypothetical protein
MDKYIGRQVFTREVLRSTQLVIPTVPLVYTTTHYLLHLFNTPLHETTPVTCDLSEIVGHNNFERPQNESLEQRRERYTHS